MTNQKNNDLGEADSEFFNAVVEGLKIDKAVYYLNDKLNKLGEYFDRKF